MARPKKETEKYRNHRITIRFTDLEYSIIETENFGTVAQIEVQPDKPICLWPLM